MNSIARYGVRLATPAGDALDEAVESLRLLGYALVDSGLDASAIERLRTRFAPRAPPASGRSGSSRRAKRT